MMAKFIVETTVEVYSPEDWKFRVETIINLNRNDYRCLHSKKLEV